MPTLCRLALSVRRGALVVSVLTSLGLLVAASSAASADAGAAAAQVADLRADTNRDGVVDISPGRMTTAARAGRRSGAAPWCCRTWTTMRAGARWSDQEAGHWTTPS